MRVSGFMAQLPVQLDNRDKQPEIVNEILSQALIPARYRLQDLSTVVTGVMRNAMHKAIRNIEHLMKSVPMIEKSDGTRLELLGFL